jgi:hypothetical protein
VMGGSPMKYFFRDEIEEIAYRETVREIRTQRAASLSRDLARHGVRFADPDAETDAARNALSDDVGEIRVVA